MTFEQVSEEAAEVLGFLDNTELKPDEKVAVLRTAASVIEHTLGAEMLRAAFINILKK